MTQKTISSKIKAGYEWYTSSLDYLRSPLLLSLRLYWGWQFFATGKGKLLNLDKTVEFFTQLNLPFPHLNAILAGSTECFCGLLLLLGLGSRLISVPLIVTMVVAYLTADNEVLMMIFSNPDGFVTATPFLFLLASLIVLVFGPGLFSLDALIAKVFQRSEKPVVELRKVA